MGCIQSKTAEAAPNLATVTTCNPSLPTVKGSLACHPASLYHHFLSGMNPVVSQGTDIRARTLTFWEEARHLCSSRPELASYVDPTTYGTPLHVACSLGSAQVNTSPISGAAVGCIETVVHSYPEAASHRDKNGHIPLEGVFSGMCAEYLTDIEPNRTIAESFFFRTETAKLLLIHDSKTVLVRGGLLYQIIESLPDDSESPLGPTVTFVNLLVQQCGATTQRTAALSKSTRILEGTEIPDDDVLALLYRRFVRQFDQSEGFFEGDNSRNEVVQHRRRFKNAAVNTFNIIELLLRQPYEGHGSQNDLLVHNAVRTGLCPPDLLRYIVETNLESVAEADSKGNLPLHYAAGHCEESVALGHPHQALPESYSKYVIDELLYAYPDGATMPNADGVLPIVLAIESGKKWIGGGVRSLYEAYPSGIEGAHLGDQHPFSHAKSFHSDEDRSSDQSVTTELPGAHYDKKGSIATGVDGGGGRHRKRQRHRKINKDESHDAVMFVQRPHAPVRDVVTTMWANEEDGGVQMLGCSALELAATEAGSGEEASLSVALLGVTAVVNAMKNHPNEPAVQEKACSALAAMACADGVREISFAASGAISTVVSAMQAHVSDVSVQREACRALRSIAVNGGAERATVVASVSGFTALVNSMGAHPLDKCVQREACAALEVLTSFHNAYLPELYQQIETLLHTAAHNFPEDCLESSSKICARLNATPY